MAVIVSVDFYSVEIWDLNPNSFLFAVSSRYVQADVRNYRSAWYFIQIILIATFRWPDTSMY